MSADTPRKPLIERLHARSKAWADLWEVASHIGVFPLDCCMIDSRLEAEAAEEIVRLQEIIKYLEKEISQTARDAYVEGQWEARQGADYGSY